MDQTPATWQEVVNKHPDVFKDKLGLVQGVTAKFRLTFR